MGVEAELIQMGFEAARVRQSITTCGEHFEACVAFLLNAKDDPDLVSGRAASVSQDLIEMGFDAAAVLKAVAECGESLEACMDWIANQPPAAVAPSADSETAQKLRAMGFGNERIRQAIRACGEKLDATLQWLVEDEGQLDETAPPPAKVQKKAALPAAVAAPAPMAAAAARPAAAIGAAAVAAARSSAPRAAAAAPRAAAAASAGGAAAAASSSSASSSSTSKLKRNTELADSSRSLKRLMREYQQLQSHEQRGGCRKLHAFEAEPIDESDLYTWDLRLYDFAADDPISSDMASRGIDHLTLRARFPADYPNSPPFVYMLRPRLKEGSGYVLSGGGICMELLTQSGWSPATSIEALVQSVRAMLMAGQARLRETARSAKEHEYSYDEAQRDFQHILKVHGDHGWTSHPLFKDA